MFVNVKLPHLREETHIQMVVAIFVAIVFAYIDFIPDSFMVAYAYKDFFEIGHKSAVEQNFVRGVVVFNTIVEAVETAFD